MMTEVKRFGSPTPPPDGVQVRSVFYKGLTVLPHDPTETIFGEPFIRFSFDNSVLGGITIRVGEGLLHSRDCHPIPDGRLWDIEFQFWNDPNDPDTEWAYLSRVGHHHANRKGDS